MELNGALQLDNRRQAHVEAPHGPPFLCVRLHGPPNREYSLMKHMADGNILRKAWEHSCCPQFIELSAVCNSKIPFLKEISSEVTE
jgi:hypothetical protein